jgi:hypothetical protein
MLIVIFLCVLKGFVPSIFLLVGLCFIPELGGLRFDMGDCS